MKSNFNKRLLVVVLVLSMVLSSFAFAFAAEDSDTLELTILHTNDIHGRIVEDRFDGMGFARIDALVREFREDRENVLLLDAGDTVHGQPYATIPEGESIITIMNEIGYDYMVAGNHDFNYGYQRLIELEEMADFPIFAGNVVYEATGEPIIEKEYDVIEYGDIQIGIFGLATPETLFKSHPAGTAGLEFLNPVTYAQGMMDHFDDEYDLDFVISLAHLGIDESTKYEERSSGVATEVDGIDLIVDGHSHSFLEGGRMYGDTMVVQVEDYGKHLGVVEVVFDGEDISITSGAVLKEEAMERFPDEDALPLWATISEIMAEVDEQLSEVIGENKIYLNGEREYVRAGETNLGNLLTDAMRDASEADIAFSNGGGIRASIDVGDITKGDVASVLPFGNALVTLEITGQEMIDALEIGASDYPEPKGAFLQISGASYEIDTSAEYGERIKNVMVDDEPIDLEKSYLVATNDFVAAGGDGYELFAEMELVTELHALDEVVITYIQELGVVEMDTEGRITEYEEADDPVDDEDDPVDDEDDPVDDEDEDEEPIPQTGDQSPYVMLFLLSSGMIVLLIKRTVKA
ncbi:bifunctional metallophosphatase/5'-nucleotidase [Isachenkonia alkalipeptolytica]|uniref:Multifunctional 2',3'-cyclic-nucleotide 2'-phosphodiesterase/5'-nucleotidase/3'-nucleotidase n=1 Tax=Isachenkonia alkalipeptolytica TaxID=2565777 RepID=A0AA44BEL9_9CLOT|nr:5'-nucleotidase C-terminal domain-containing protein [Isachenkonia alkalipeptolytica]NBG89414.1 multifunctional 2',3'-cyclic-nucleotide 2'-phosphodiesterase/5'-nucleotidase/3'-nucleotidase [Isachenkonia alkalipeptolytica]